jgi:hypothetical protein
LKRGIVSSLAKQLGLECKTIARQWYNMEKSLSTLLSIHPEDDPNGIVQRSHHILFQSEHCKRHAGKFKYYREDLKVTIASFTCKQHRTMRLLAGQLKFPVAKTSTKGFVCLWRHHSKATCFQAQAHFEGWQQAMPLYVLCCPSQQRHRWLEGQCQVPRPNGLSPCR